MSKINAVRIINLNYNNNAIRINDETFHLDGNSTLLSLRNGGGKSVLVQMITAPFVHKRYRDAKDRPFESYFTTNKPTFILVEWVLDQGAGYVLTGMMVRKSQSAAEDTVEELEIVNFISEYKEPCTYDIHHLPVIQKTKKEMNLKGFVACQQLFESYRKNQEIEFYSYDMNHQAQSKQYFDKLKEYQINDKEWESIIKKVNLKESGLSELFSDCKDEKGLIEKWFLDAVESKLNKEKNRMKEFEHIVTKYINQYKDNQSKIMRRDTIRMFKEEAQVLLEEAKEYQQASLEVQKSQQRIAGFIQEMERLEEVIQEEEKKEKEQEEILEKELRHIGYEQISYEIYEKKEKQDYHISTRNIIDLERDGMEKDCEKMTRKIREFECARWLADTQNSQSEYELAKERLDIVKKNQEDLAPERSKLGGLLKSWYEQANLALELKIAEQEEAKKTAVTQQEIQNEKIEGYREEILKNGTRKGELKSKIESYDKEEEKYNQRYQENMVRNILGEYEPAALELKKESCEREKEQRNRAQISRKREIEQGNEQLKSFQRTIEDTRKNINQSTLRKAEEERNLSRLEHELKERRTILKYLELQEDVIFDTKHILDVFKRKRNEIEMGKRAQEKELDEMEKELRKLTQGTVLELPKEFEEMLNHIGIHPVYGMDWLKRNGNSVQKNQTMVKENPFIPYALILSEQDMKKLTKYGEQIYTSFPIPIIKRETLESAKSSFQGGLISMEQLSFYVLFNDNLLDEEQLRILMEQKETLIEKKKQLIVQKVKELDAYIEKQEKIRNQEVTLEGYENLLEKINAFSEELQKLDVLLDQQKENIRTAEETLKLLQVEFTKEEKHLHELERKTEDLQLLFEQYQQYCKNRKDQQILLQKMDQLNESKDRSQKQVQKLAARIAQLEEELYQRKNSLEKLEEKRHLYDSFESQSQGINQNITEDEIIGVESRYQAITQTISAEQKELEETLRKKKERFEKNQEELKYLEDKYQFSKENYQDVCFSRKEKERMEEELNRKLQDKSLSDIKWNEEDKKIALIRQKIEDCYERMEKEYEKTELVPKKEIVFLDFETRKNKKAENLKRKQEQLAVLERKYRGYAANLNALTEYNEFTVGENIIWEVDFFNMSDQELGNFKGMMVRDYNENIKIETNKRDVLVRELNRILRVEAFADEFFKKPLEVLVQLTNDANQVILQLSTTLSSYEGLMEKLEVDIAMIEKERDKVVELLEDYIREVHHNLMGIDKNSTITIRERQIKMLKLKLPNWEENKAMYEVRLQDFMEEITQRSMKILDKNENIAEYLGSKMTTKFLYDTVVGIGNIEINLYKIEERREYPITWAEVAKNSGGEGFLSAFVILNSLLYYMRKDDTDIFADRTEGKVLVMDNPFAQTNAEHLLKPLMDMADKTNTQLICLSGLGGESIYSRFDNIYVLNLISANLRNGMQYLKANHMKGSQEEEMILSRIEVTKQMELEF
ncbi:MAG: hypothetical protein RR139_03490 [Lachnospiraceae bacterium]